MGVVFGILDLVVTIFNNKKLNVIAKEAEDTLKRREQKEIKKKELKAKNESKFSSNC